MNHEDFKKKLTKEIDNFLAAIATDSGEWIVKGFIDVYKNIYTISVDTKVISKIIELMLFPLLVSFAEKYKYKIVLSENQNHYPDMSFVPKDGTKIALDLKSTYRTSTNRVNGFTLGAFTGYFRDQKSSKNITFPYSEYSSHLVLGVVYNRSKETADERKTYEISDLKKITSVIRDFEFIIQEKWKIAGEKPGSGNTKNIGSC
ncbi:MAG: restriction endonuclease, partial [Candidatus Heimdallarchaeota archaeon]|nr:restriction endonuclease [Candidatus Heimdallarchaeota archaeon]